MAQKRHSSIKVTVKEDVKAMVYREVNRKLVSEGVALVLL